MSAVPVGMPVKLIDVEIDGRTVRVPEGATILDACRAEGIDTPTMCYADSLTPVNACRVCVVEVEGSRTLVPACSRPAEADMKVTTDSERVRQSRPRGVEFLASSGTAYSVEIRASNPRPATAIANVCCASVPHASTHL